MRSGRPRTCFPDSAVDRTPVRRSPVRSRLLHLPHTREGVARRRRVARALEQRELLRFWRHGHCRRPEFYCLWKSAGRGKPDLAGLDGLDSDSARTPNCGVHRRNGMHVLDGRCRQLRYLRRRPRAGFRCCQCRQRLSASVTVCIRESGDAEFTGFGSNARHRCLKCLLPDYGQCGVKRVSRWRSRSFSAYCRSRLG